MVSYLILLNAVIKKRHLIPEHSHINLLFWLTIMKSTEQGEWVQIYCGPRNEDFFQQFVSWLPNRTSLPSTLLLQQAVLCHAALGDP